MKLLFLPWICKPLYASFVERTRSKKWWLVFSMTMLALACLLVSQVELNAIEVSHGAESSFPFLVDIVLYHQFRLQSMHSPLKSTNGWFAVFYSLLFFL